MRSSEVLRSLDWVLLGAAILLSIIGLAMLFSATYGEQNLLDSRFLRQAVAVAVAVAAGYGVARLPYHALKRYGPLLYGSGIVGLVVVYFVAHVIRGAASRLNVAGFQLQPSEFMKVALVVGLAWWLYRQRRLTWTAMAGSAMVVGLPVVLILLEPDLGMAILLAALGAVVVIFMGLSAPAIGIMVVSVAAAGAVAWRWLLQDYQRDRILVFFDPTNDPLGAGYNIVQSIVALGSGRVWGRGLGHGPQSQLQFLPERHTDFILASIGEELGFVGVAAVILLYVVVLWRMLSIARTTHDSFGQLLVVGSFVILLLSLVVSAGMNMGLLPVTGIPLPLVSYGGSNLVSTFLLLGLVQSVRVYSKWVQVPPIELTHLT